MLHSHYFSLPCHKIIVIAYMIIISLPYSVDKIDFISALLRNLVLAIFIVIQLEFIQRRDLPKIKLLEIGFVAYLIMTHSHEFGTLSIVGFMINKHPIWVDSGKSRKTGLINIKVSIKLNFLIHQCKKKMFKYHF